MKNNAHEGKKSTLSLQTTVGTKSGINSQETGFFTDHSAYSMVKCRSKVKLEVVKRG